jgi:hypothetical protein
VQFSSIDFPDTAVTLEYGLFCGLIHLARNGRKLGAFNEYSVRIACEIRWECDFRCSSLGWGRSCGVIVKGGR